MTRVKRLKAGLRWLSDPSDEMDVDDLFANGANVHLERMSNTHVWIGITVGDRTFHVDIHSKRKIGVFARDLPPRSKR